MFRLLQEFFNFSKNFFRSPLAKSSVALQTSPAIFPTASSPEVFKLSSEISLGILKTCSEVFRLFQEFSEFSQVF
ncbi:hypothetical protein Phum_PHUM359430 [Pediculus humanus corporis]|uniref:Uncharacterized protein n=1 Tax=Pediculus humanus subsp. corporis TaxID=121224 RepID=E0VPG8_PEDHC|nr:uncharacterized protein Phum_PHUM359430 [Pediculus humanus corporis]EEB15274.1 hypothetical protein Phum_PHUM359430 [Pediculus humanus corporis]